MNDRRLRLLDRAWRETGTVADETALLAAEHRRGALSRQRLELAAQLGSEAARAIVGWAEAPAVTVYFDGINHGPDEFYEEFRCAVDPLMRYLVGIAFCGPEATARTLVGLAWSMHYEFRLAFPGDPIEPACLRAMDEWIVCPCDDHAREVSARAGALSDFIRRHAPERKRARLGDVAVEAAYAITGAAEPRRVFVMVAIALEGFDPDSIRAVVISQVMPWALGREDPVADRVATSWSKIP